jgi:hypothetical protein
MRIRGIDMVQVIESEDDEWLETINIGGQECLFAHEYKFEIPSEEYVRFTKILIGLFPETYEYYFETLATDKYLKTNDCMTFAKSLTDHLIPVQSLGETTDADDFLWFYKQMHNCAMMGMVQGFLIID